jgi:hypothetical protein
VAARPWWWWVYRGRRRRDLPTSGCSSGGGGLRVIPASGRLSWRWWWKLLRAQSPHQPATHTRTPTRPLTKHTRKPAAAVAASRNHSRSRGPVGSTPHVPRHHTHLAQTHHRRKLRDPPAIRPDDTPFRC